MTFIAISNSKTLIFIITVSIFIIITAFLSIFFKFYHFHQNTKLKRFFNNKNIVYLSSLIGLIFGIIFSSFVGFHNLNIYDVSNNIWLWDCISFLYALGMYLVALGFIFAWLIIPFVAWKAVFSFLKQEKNWKLEFKKIGFILFLITISLIITNITWIIPFNDVSTSLTIFKVSNTTFQKDMWFKGSKFLFDYAFLTVWYSWTFLGYSIVVFCICFLVASILNKQNKLVERERFKKIEKGLCLPYLIIDLWTCIGTFAFICTYFLFNWISLFVHIGLVIFYFLTVYLIVNMVFLMIISIKYKQETNKKTLIKILFIDSFKNKNQDYIQAHNQIGWWYEKNRKVTS